jgi:membrane protein DedA with SNARE-associated domain
MNWKKFSLEAICGFSLWTAFLTPYMIFVTQVTFEQYLTWIGMQAILVPPISIVVVGLTNRIVGRFAK